VTDPSKEAPMDTVTASEALKLLDKLLG